MRKPWVNIIAIVLSLMVTGLVVACTASPPSFTQTPTPTNSESASTISELEAKIRQLEAENQRLTTENQRLNNDLAKADALLEDVYSLVTSSSYIDTLSKLDELQSKSSDLAAYVQGLSDLPPLPLGINCQSNR